MKSLVILLVFIIFVVVVIKYVKMNQECPPPIIKFRRIPKTFHEEQTIQTPISYKFQSMFDDNSTWARSIGFSINVPKR
jgi:hypothetical protein